MKAEDSERTEVVQFRVTPKERDLIEKYAKKDGFTVSQYVRGTLIMDMAVMQHDVEAMKIVFAFMRKAGKDAVDAFKKKLGRSLGEEKALERVSHG